MWATKNTCSDCGLFEKEDGKWRDGEGKKHFHRMEMCGELIEKIEEMEESDGSSSKNR